MKIHKEGYQFIISQIIIILILSLIIVFDASFFMFILLSSFILIFAFTLYFFRIPKRTFERKENVIYSPCDGKVVIIEEVKEIEFYKDIRLQISIFMSPLNPHNQLYPISGRVKYTKYHPGKYIVAWHPKSSLLNERSSVIVENKKISILFRQIAGKIARRIITYSKVGDIVKCSEEYGFIKFGSRIDMFLPLDTSINIRVGEKVKAGKSIIGTY